MLCTRYKALEYNTMLNITRKDKIERNCLEYEFAKDNTYLTRMGKLQAVIPEFVRENIPQDWQCTLLSFEVGIEAG